MPVSSSRCRDICPRLLSELMLDIIPLAQGPEWRRETCGPSDAGCRLQMLKGHVVECGRLLIVYGVPAIEHHQISRRRGRRRKRSPFCCGFSMSARPSMMISGQVMSLARLRLTSPPASIIRVIARTHSPVNCAASVKPCSSFSSLVIHSPGYHALEDWGGVQVQSCRWRQWRCRRRHDRRTCLPQSNATSPPSE